MSDSENYFSDSDNSATNEEVQGSVSDEEEELSEYELDEETRAIIYKASLEKKSTDLSSFCSPKEPKKKKVRERKQKDVKRLNFEEFVSKIEEDKPKKWKSKRSLNKKKELGIEDEQVRRKRTFNPRLPPPTFETFQKKLEEDDSLNNSEENFPSLS